MNGMKERGVGLHKPWVGYGVTSKVLQPFSPRLIQKPTGKSSRRHFHQNSPYTSSTTNST